MLLSNCSNTDNIRLYRLLWRYVKIHGIGTEITIPNFILSFTYPKIPVLKVFSPFYIIFHPSVLWFDHDKNSFLYRDPRCLFCDLIADTKGIIARHTIFLQRIFESLKRNPFCLCRQREKRYISSKLVCFLHRKLFVHQPDPVGRIYQHTWYVMRQWFT